LLLPGVDGGFADGGPDSLVEAVVEQEGGEEKEAQQEDE
jgi:hypothetical protein